MLKPLITTLLLATLAAFATAEAGPMTLLEEAAEFQNLDARVSGDRTGSMRVTACDQCEPLRLKLQPSTKLEINGQPQRLDAINRGTLRDGTVFYNPRTRAVMRIVATR